MIIATKKGGVSFSNANGPDINFIASYINQTINENNPSDTDAPQSVLDAIENALKTSILLSHPVVLVFANREDASKTLPVSSLADQSTETRLRQMVLAWHARIYFFINKDPNYNITTTSNGYDAYRRMAKASHGDLIAYEQDELPNIMNSFIPRLYKPEMTSVMSYVLFNKIQMDVNRDYADQPVTVTVSVDRDYVSDSLHPQMYLKYGGGILNADDQLSLKYLKVFSLPSSFTSFSLASTLGVTVSVRVFVSSDSTFIFAHAANRDIDNGTPNNVAEYANAIHARPLNMGGLSSLYTQSLSASVSSPVYDPNYAAERAGDWNMNYQFPMIPYCLPGVYTQRFVATLPSKANITRVYPGFCFHTVYHPHVIPPPPAPTTPLVSNMSCHQKNLDAIGDARLKNFRQLVFAVDVSIQMQSLVYPLETLIETVVTDTNDGNLIDYYTLILFNGNAAFAAVHSYEAADFMMKASSELQKALTAAAPAATVKSIEAINLAKQLVFVGPAQVNVLTSRISSGTPSILPKDMQVNLYYISADQSYPADPSMNIMVKQGGGRTVVISDQQITTLRPIIVKSVQENNLLVDSAFVDCTAGVVFPVFVDESSSSVSFTLTGKDVRVTALLDGANKTVAIDEATNVSLRNNKSLILKFDKITGVTRGTWRLYMGSSGVCYCQARAVSDVAIMIGFTSDPNNDMVAQQPTFRRGDIKTGTYVMARVVDNNNLYSFGQVVMAKENVEQPWLTNDLNLASYLHKRDENSCAYQYRSDILLNPDSSVISVTLLAQYKENTSIKRVFYYYTPVGTNTGIEGCAHGAANTAGECQCSPNYTGELCDQPVCQNGGINSNGVCDCADSGFTGSLCELVVLNSTDVNTVAPPNTASPTIVPPPSTPNTPKGAGEIGASVTILLLFSICRF